MKPHLLPILFIVTISLAIYVNTLKNGFVYDDKLTIVENTFIKDLGNLPMLFESKGYFSSSGEATYRPIVTFTYFIDYALYGLKPWGFHLTNLFLHAINGVLLYAFATLLIRPLANSNRESVLHHIFSSQPFLISLLFVTHPILTESVNSISFREDLLAFLFYMATLNLYLLIRTKPDTPIAKILYFLSCLLYLLALFSKEMALTLPLVICCYEWICGGQKNLRAIIFDRYNIGYIAITAFYIYLSFYYFHYPLEGNILGQSLTERLLTLPWLLLSYLKLTLFPISLTADYVIKPVESIFSLLFIIPLLAVFFLLAVTMIKREKTWIAFGIGFFCIILIPVYNIIPIANPLADRYLYLPTAGFVLVIGSLIYNLLGSQKLKSETQHLYTVIFLSGLIVIYSFAAIKRNEIWENEYTLWSDTIKKMPKSGRAHTNLGIAYSDKGLLDRAFEHQQIAILLAPDDPNTRNNLGITYYQKGRLDEAAQEFKTALDLKPDDPEIHYNMGRTYKKQERWSEAILEYTKTIELKPDHELAHADLGNIYSKFGRFGEAIAEYTEVVSLKVGDAMAYSNLGNAYYQVGNTDEAIRNYEQALKIEPFNSIIHYNLGAAYQKKGLKDMAIKEFETSLKLEPDYASAVEALRKLSQ